jgi:signal transduction histidine kinase
MKIQTKIIGTLLIVTLLSFATIYISVLQNQKELEKKIGGENTLQAKAMIEHADSSLVEMISHASFHGSSLIVLRAIEESNKEFEAMQNREQYIDEIDKKWINAVSDEDLPLIKTILDSDASLRLKDIVKFYEKENFSTYGEIFVTNVYGIIVGTTDKTSDYRQNDEGWWQKAKADGFFIEEPTFDESSQTTGFTIAHSILDRDGNFIGVIKEVLNQEELNKIIEESAKSHGYGGLKIKILDNNGNVIYESQNTPHSSNFSNSEVYKKMTGDSGYFETLDDWVPNQEQKKVFLFYARSKGYEKFQGFNWTLFIERDKGEVFSASEHLKNRITLIAAIMCLVVLTISIFLTISITNPLRRLVNAAKEVSSGNFSVKANIKTKDELGVLAKAFDEMINSLKKYQTELLKNEKQKSFGLEKEVTERTSELKNYVEDLEKVRTATLNMMEDLQETNKHLKDVDSAKSNFLNIVSHELKTPLTAIYAYLDVIADSKNKLSEDQLKGFNAIKRNSQQLKMLIGNILEISRIEAGKFELAQNEINPKENLEKITQNLKILTDKKGLKLILDCKKLPDKIMTDEPRFEEVINNLVTNAIKFTDKGSVTINAKQDKEFILICVKDTGVGIPKDKIKNLFQKFYQVDSSISRKYGGTGLGLSITKEMIERQGGKIWVESTEGKGTTFFFTLPIKGVKSAASSSSSSSSSISDQETDKLERTFKKMKGGT